MTKTTILNPNENELQEYLRKWNNLESVTIHERAFDNLFLKTYPNNTEIDEVLIKVISLNAFYSTNIFYPYTVAQHIITLDIDKKLYAKDISLVEEIAKVTMDNGKVRKLYSFATKYCSRHKPLVYPIYDSYIDKVLKHLRDHDNFYMFKTEDLKDYISFNDILKRFREYYNLETYSVKEIDKYLWLLGKEKLPNKY
ncbi:MAG: hypothetical protein JJE17_04440 [Peptostreptococcaceae bacterium]|nr:hypothetical protein [Peptostreptococcaceae bacterium]